MPKRNAFVQLTLISALESEMPAEKNLERLEPEILLLSCFATCKADRLPI